MNRRIALLLIIILPAFFSCTEKEQEIRVESVTISMPSAELEIGKTLQLSATVTPTGATNKDITWSSSNPSVASISAAGLVTALSEGTTTITAAADGKKGECKVSVVKAAIAVTEVKLDKTELTLYEGEEETLTTTVLPDDATDKTIVWTSSDNSIATIESGKVKAVKKGEATITAKAGDKTAEAKIVVLTPISGISLNKDKLTLYIGETETLTATLTPAEATLKDPISWTSSDEAVATIADGKITTVGKGTAKITATAYGKSASCDIEVLRPVTEISLDKTTLEIPLEKTETLTASIIPADATPRGEITWSSSNTDVATVDEGKVTALSIGSTTVTASLEGFKAECAVTVKGMEYGKIAITDVRPVDILPVIGQVTVGDKEVYNHIEHLRLAEATRIRDMMWEYGAGDHSKEQYQQLMGRLRTGMMQEALPTFIDDVEIIGRYYHLDDLKQGSPHSHIEWSILNSIVNKAQFILAISAFQEDDMGTYLSDNPKAIVILGCSAWGERYGDEYGDEGFIMSSSEDPNIIKHCKAGRLILFKSGGNIHEHYDVLVNKCFHKDVKGDEHGIYSLQSIANGKNDSDADMALFVTIGTNANGDMDQTNEIYASSLFPVGFHDKVVFAGRAFPYSEFNSGVISAEGSTNNGKYATSFTNYVNVAMMSICFQMYAEANDVFELLDMVRSTCLTDYIRLNGQTQPLQLINPAGLYKKYLTPQNLPSLISTRETLPLDKGYYKGVLFSIPGAEVKVNGEWIAFDSKNKEVILSQNPMNLEWRLNGNLIKKYGYAPGQTVEGQIITVDDKWGGLRLEVPMTVQVR